MRRLLANRYPRLVMALMVVAAMLSGGGVAKHAHLWSAHSHHGCAAGGSCITHALPKLCGHDHHRHSGAPAKSDAPEGGGSSTHVDGGCAVCAQLACLTPTLPVASPFTTVLAVLSLVELREVPQQPDPAPLEACSARPPPSLA